MKRIGLLSDTHGFIDQKILGYFNDVDEIWHAGDIGSLHVLEALKALKPVKAVYGNIDDESIQQEVPEDLIFEVENVKVWMTHIGGYPGKYTQRVKKKIYQERPKLFICGHSHILKVMTDPKDPFILHMNPGAIGQHGFHQKRTMLRFKLNEGVVSDLEVIDLGKRGKL